MNSATQVLVLLESQPGAPDRVEHYRQARTDSIGKARLCATAAGRQSWVDLAREANLRLVAAKRFRRLREQTEAQMDRACGSPRMTVRQAS